MSSELKSEILEHCRSLDIPLVGFASADSWDDAPLQPWPPQDFHPRSIFPETNSVIVIGLPISLPILETTPSIYYHELYGTVNTALDLSTYRLSVYLTERGYPSIYVPRDGYGSISILKDKPTAFFSHRHAAYLAGLGCFGISNMLLTKKYGPRVRFGSIFTSAKLPADKIMKEGLCTECMSCVKKCPTQCLDSRPYPSGLTRKEACAAYNDKLKERFLSPCGVCIKVCPVGDDREVFDRGDASIYDDLPEHQRYRQAWKHVQSYGSR